MTHEEQERIAAFDQLVKEEQLDADKLKKVIDRFAYTGERLYLTQISLN